MAEYVGAGSDEKNALNALAITFCACGTLSLVFGISTRFRFCRTRFDHDPYAFSKPIELTDVELNFINKRPGYQLH